MPKKILIVEDNEKNLKLFTRIVLSMGHEVVSARNGEDGLKAAGQEQPDLILSDIQMPKMDGLTVLRKLREGPRTAAIPVIALTSYAMVDDRKRLLEAGFVHYISKPIDMDGFMRDIQRFLGNE